MLVQKERNHMYSCSPSSRYLPLLCPLCCSFGISVHSASCRPAPETLPTPTQQLLAWEAEAELLKGPTCMVYRKFSVFFFFIWPHNDSNTPIKDMMVCLIFSPSVFSLFLYPLLLGHAGRRPKILGPDQQVLHKDQTLTLTCRYLA